MLSNLLRELQTFLFENLEKTLRMKMPNNSKIQLLVERNEIINQENGERTHMEPRLTRILEMLLLNQGRVVSRESIIRSIWGNYNSGEELLTHSISMIRKKIGDDTIKTVPKKGYLIESNRLVQPIASITNRLNYWWLVLVVGFIMLRLIFGHH